MTLDSVSYRFSFLASRCTRRALLTLLVLGLAACGGGGGGDSGGPSSTDSDGDGVVNTSDQCANTPAGATVDTQGCATSQLDADSDGVSDDVDTCPATPSGESVDASGCGVVTQGGDSDSDGVADTDDACPDTPADQSGSVDGVGCAPSQLDADNDSVSDDLDVCPDTPAEEPVDIEGCGLITQGGTDGDADGDGVADSVDDCPVTPDDELLVRDGCSDSQLDDDMDGVANDVDTCDSTPAGEVIDERGCGTTTETGVVASAFLESEGLLVVEMENTLYPTGWVLRTGREASGNAYLVWIGGDNFNNPGEGIIDIPIEIASAGTYRFSWRSVITIGDEPTEANDTWLQINANNFFGEKIEPGGGNNPSAVGHIVCPVGKPSSNTCVGDIPEGSSGQGWFKVYRAGGPAENWTWITSTSDNDRHELFAVFDAAGRYNIRISGRSDGHGIDRLVMYRSQNDSDNVERQVAVSISTPESSRE